jgi:hypothetical protein
MDLVRSIDYLQTRSDIDARKLAYYGVSMGAAQGARLIAVEPRFRTAVLCTGGGLCDDELPEIDAFNLPRACISRCSCSTAVTFHFPMTTHSRPLFDALGTGILRGLQTVRGRTRQCRDASGSDQRHPRLARQVLRTSEIVLCLISASRCTRRSSQRPLPAVKATHGTEQDTRFLSRSYAQT